MSAMNPAISTLDRGHINVLVWPVFGGMMAWIAFMEGVTLRIGAQDEASLEGRVKEGLTQLWEHLDLHHEDGPRALLQYRTCWPWKERPVKVIPVPAAPPYLESGALDHFIEQAYQ